MNDDLIDYVAGETSISKEAAVLALDAWGESIADALKRGDDVVLKPLGTLCIAERPERTGHNPKTGNEIKIPAGKTIKFRQLHPGDRQAPAPEGKAGGQTDDTQMVAMLVERSDLTNQKASLAHSSIKEYIRRVDGTDSKLKGFGTFRREVPGGPRKGTPPLPGDPSILAFKPDQDLKDRVLGRTH
ncbi:HU family DNA-binding protein [Streptomyces sp. NPDC053560]|uniref:HU family DNA-binding protein n=1 Tax=Streptomyces sp. NPDC053560 TaxID=3365711 RepID=UPI0037D10997